MSSLAPIINHGSAAERFAETQQKVLDLEKLVKDVLPIITSKTASAADKLAAYMRLSGYINGTDPQWSCLHNSFDDAQRISLKNSVLECFKQVNDVELRIGEGHEKHSSVYARVLKEDGTPATLADLVNNLSTDKKFKFSFNEHDVNVNKFAHPFNGAMGNACPGHSSTDLGTTAPGQSIHVEAHTAACEATHMDCSGGAAALIAYCSGSHQTANGAKDPNFNYTHNFDNYLRDNYFSK